MFVYIIFHIDLKNKSCRIFKNEDILSTFYSFGVKAEKVRESRDPLKKKKHKMADV